jgi:hypothetical protein
MTILARFELKCIIQPRRVGKLVSLVREKDRETGLA